MRDIIIYGAGGFGRETALMIRQINRVKPSWNILGFCDDGKTQEHVVDGFPVIGGIKELNAYGKPMAVALAVADPGVRKKIRDAIVNNLITYPALIHPSVITGDDQTVKIGEGTIICAGTILTTNIRIESFVIINLLCSIGHDVSVGDFCSIMPGCSLSGFDEVESGVLIGTGARILAQVTIRKGSRVGAGAVVTREVLEGETVVGIPAKPLRDGNL